MISGKAKRRRDGAYPRRGANRAADMEHFCGVLATGRAILEERPDRTHWRFDWGARGVLAP